MAVVDRDSADPSTGRRSSLYVQWVVKVSKQCNLRCRYCYEFPFLADPARMQLAQLERMFRHIAERYAGSPERMDFVWHGGEPLLLPPAFYRSVVELQRRIFDEAGIAFANSVQTNLVHAPADVLELFGTVFGSVGVSIDLFGNQRVNVAGRPVERTVIENMQRLKDREVVFGCITVLSQATAPHVEDIYRFFEDINAGFRLLPIYRTGYAGQQDALALTHAEIVDAFKKVVRIWMTTDTCLTVLPIHDYVTSVVSRLSGQRGRWGRYDKLDREIVYIVDTDGSLYSNADAYDLTLCHGNIFEQSLEAMHASDGYLRAVAAARDRMAATCLQCHFHGPCSGYFMAEATPEQRWRDDAGALLCGVAQPMQSYIERMLIDAGVVDTERSVLLTDKLRERADKQALDVTA